MLVALRFWRPGSPMQTTGGAQGPTKEHHTSLRRQIVVAGLAQLDRPVGSDVFVADGMQIQRFAS